MKRIRIQLTFVAQFPDDFDDTSLQNINGLAAHGIVAFLKSEQEVVIEGGARLGLTFTPRAPRRKAAKSR